MLEQDGSGGVMLVGGADEPAAEGQPGTAEATGAAEAGPQIGETQQASPEEQAQYDTVVGNAFSLIYSQKTLPRILEILQSGDPIDGLATASAMIISRIVDSAEHAGQQLSGDVALNAGTEIFEDLANLSGEAGIHDFGKDKDGLEAAYFRALDQFRVMQQENGKIDPEAAQQDMAALQKMDEAGELEAMFSRLAEQDGDTGEPEAEEPAPAPKGGLMQQEMA